MSRQTASAESPIQVRHSPGRLAYLDGLRLVAILAVMLYHFGARWAPPTYEHSLYPFGDELSHIGVIRYGWLGVQFFFVISGFVISMTLTRCSSMWEFASRRYARLAPAMLLCSILTYAVITLVPTSPFSASPLWFTSSATFLDPDDLNLLAGAHRFDSIDGAYWSLYVEAKFYLLAALAYFLVRPAFHWILTGIALTAAAIRLFEPPVIGGLVDHIFIARDLPWFVMGVGFYLIHRNSLRLEYLAVIGAGMIAAASVQEGPSGVPLWAIVSIPALYGMVMHVKWLQKILGVRMLSAAGAASYSAYLLHQNIGVTVLNFLQGPMGPVEAWLLVLALMLGVVLASLAFFRAIEQPASRWLLERLLRR